MSNLGLIRLQLELAIQELEMHCLTVPKVKLKHTPHTPEPMRIHTLPDQGHKIRHPGYHNGAQKGVTYHVQDQLRRNPLGLTLAELRKLLPMYSGDAISRTLNALKSDNRVTRTGKSGAYRYKLA